MGKCNKEISKNLEFRRKTYVHPNVETAIANQIKSGDYQLQNLSKPIKKSGVFYQNGIGLLTSDQIQLFGLTNYHQTQIPFLIGGKDEFKAMIGLISTENLDAKNQAYLELLSVYGANTDLLKKLKQEKNILNYQVLQQLGLDYSVTGPLVNIDKFGIPSQIRHKDDNTLEGRIASQISPFIEYIFQIRDEDSQLMEIASDEIKEKGENFKFSFAA